MELTGGGTVIMLTIAAALWFLYLVPTWVRRREYLATERNATRIQQTVRIMAETAELPDSVRLAANAREAARAERLLRAQQRRADAIPRMLATTTVDALKRRRMRRTRLFASILMIAATALGLIQIWLMATTGVTLGSWLVLAGTLAAGGVAIATQRRLDVRSMPKRVVQVSAPTRGRMSWSPDEEAPVRPAQPAPWTPAPVPKPLYLSKPAPVRRESVLPVVEETRPAATVTPMRQEPALPRRSGFAAMGIVDPSDTAAPDLDEVLRRRRSVG